MRAASSAIAAEVIAVPVRGDQVVDLREAGVLDRGHDATGVAHRGRAGVSRVDQQRLADGDTNSVALPPSTSTT